MNASQISVSAFMTAYIRAYHARNDNPVIFHDILSAQFIPQERRNLIEQGLHSAVQPNDFRGDARGPSDVSLASLLQTMGLPNVVSRSRYTEDHLQAEIATGVEQYVILGAGLDTFAFRHKDLLESIRVFEVDRGITQEFKRDRLRELEWEVPANLHFVQADFSRERIADVLLRAPFHPKAKSFFSLLGVTMYLSERDVYETLSAITRISPAGSSVIFDYHTVADPNLEDVRKELKKAGESMNTTFAPEALAVELPKLGFCLREDLGPSAIQQRYFNQSDTYRANENVHLAWAVVN